MDQKSEFASTLKDMLDATELFSRKEWALVLGVTEEVIAEWVADISVPTPYNLFMIIATIERSIIPSKKVLDLFLEMSDRPAIEVSPHGNQMLPTVREYCSRRVFPH